MSSPKNKKEIDKEYLFNLIMPTAASSNLPQEQTEAPRQEGPSLESDDAQDSLSQLRQRLHRPAAPGVELRPRQELLLVNLMEQLVADRLDDVFAKFNCCRCDKCRRDVAALALNLLPPHYVVTTSDELPGLLASAPTKDVSSALVKAILQVKNHPRH